MLLSQHTAYAGYPGPTIALLFGVVLLAVGIAQLVMPHRTLWTMLARRNTFSNPRITSSPRGNRIAGVLLILGGLIVIGTNIYSMTSN